MDLSTNEVFLTGTGNCIESKENVDKSVCFVDDFDLKIKQEYVEKEELKEELPHSLLKIEMDMNEEYLDLPKKAKLDIEEPKYRIKEECSILARDVENTLETEKKWDLVIVGSLFIVKCPECQYEELIKNANDMNLFSFHLKTHKVFKYPSTAQGFTCKHPCSICFINLMVGELMDHMRIHVSFGNKSDFWNFQQYKGRRSEESHWCVMCPVCPTSQNAEFGLMVKICNLPKHVKKVHGPFVFENMNSEKGALGCKVCGDSKVTIKKIEKHMKCIESQNDKGTQLHNNNVKDLTISQDLSRRKKKLLKLTKTKNLNTEYKEEVKMVLVVRQDLKMGKGRAAVQCSHATLAAYKSAVQKCPEVLRTWEVNGQPQLTVKVDTEEDLLTVLTKARSVGLVSAVVADVGGKQLSAGTKTVVAVGPGPVGLVNQITGALKVY